jgi:hypothetical protein
MYLEMHDNETGNSLSAGVDNIDFEYQAEEWIKETVDDADIIRWELKDQKGGKTITKWERSPGSTEFPQKVA